MLGSCSGSYMCYINCSYVLLDLLACAMASQVRASLAKYQAELRSQLR